MYFFFDLGNVRIKKDSFGIAFVMSHTYIYIFKYIRPAFTEKPL